MSSTSTVESNSALAAVTASFPNEVVTSALLTMVTVPGLPGRVALITLDNGRDTSRPSTFGPQGLASLSEALDRAFAASPTALAITGKPFLFAAGADLSGVALISGWETARALASLGQDIFRRLRESPVPTFAFVNGLALGGGLELALHCHFRTLTAGPAAVALPEVMLGILPGWGGSQLLPRIAGPDSAVTVIVENPLNQNRMLKPAEALALGVVDVVFDSADFLERSFAWLAQTVQNKVVPTARTANDEEWAAALARGRAIADAKTKGATEAPYRALKLLELSRHASLDEGLRAEGDALADLIDSEDFRAGVYASELVRKRGRHPVGAPASGGARKVTKVGVVGAGLMASQLAMLFARRLTVPVVLTDVDQSRLDAGLAGIARDIGSLAKKGRISRDEANRLSGLISGSLDYAEFADADFVIEAVFEEMSVKQQVFAELEKHVSPDAILATNTSALSVTEMGSGLRAPNRLIGFHFFNPVAVLPLVEVVRTAFTGEAALATALDIARQLRKGPILVADRPGFVVNRLLMRVMGEVLATIDEGTPHDVADSALDPLGLPMTPIMLLQLVGPGVALHVLERLHDAFPDRYSLSENLRRLVSSGQRILTAWDDEGRSTVAPDVVAQWSQGNQVSTAEQVRERALAALAVEARLMLVEGVVSDPADIDLAMLTGAGWPVWLGGITPYLDRSGISERVTGRRFAPPGVATLPQLSAPA
jgi:3-hydroxyacyl-CoA dehydrogenase/enoyl-CoA hydratase/carnithine racemase